MAKFIAKKISVDNSNLSELDGFVPPQGVSVSTLTINGNTYKRSSNYEKGQLTVKWSELGSLKYTLKTDIPAKKLKTVFKGDDWESKFFKGSDSLKGSSEGDQLYGFNGADVIHGNGGDDTLYGGKGKDTLYGGEGGDTIYGGAGKDFLDGDTGVNYLTGGGGKDTFSFSAAVTGGNYAQIEDFQVGKDIIQLARQAFEGIGAKGTLKAGQFFLIDQYDGSAKSVIYDPSSGNLHYAKDAGGEALDAQIFGRIANGAELSHKDFLIA